MFFISLYFYSLLFFFIIILYSFLHSFSNLAYKGPVYRGPPAQLERPRSVSSNSSNSNSIVSSEEFQVVSGARANSAGSNTVKGPGKQPPSSAMQCNWNGSFRCVGSAKARKRAAKAFAEKQRDRERQAERARAVTPTQVSQMTSSLMVAHAQCVRGAARLRAAGKFDDAARMMARARDLNSRRQVEPIWLFLSKIFCKMDFPFELVYQILNFKIETDFFKFF